MVTRLSTLDLNWRKYTRYCRE